ncbi:MAG TPA: phenylalanine--tRNA ligase subunit beta [Spirochaetes bacterium]|nr:phenylalanine--tRNA ligase subunit beta [Spirochaetota bacterium]
MWLSLNILSKMADLKGLDPEDMALRLTMSTAEIESVEKMNPFLDTVITVKLTAVSPHPNADKLTLCDCDSGKEKYRVVCGAPNHRVGDIVPLATVGTKFTEEFTVRKTKIRGEESTGMLCSEKELGLSDDHSGIMVLPPDTETGVPLSALYPHWTDTRLEIDNKTITHRPDLWSHMGFARELAALYGKAFNSPVKQGLLDGVKGAAPFSVSIKNPEGAPRYCGLAVKNIKIAESPQWLKAAVTAIGMRPINNIVDITNYVMSEIGEPMHAFDRKKLRGGEIIVRFAETGEKLTTLDDQEHELMSEDVVIADAGGVIALAGVMGGGNSEIDENTAEIILEAANFNPVSIRKTAARYGLRTEAAMRFEKALDPGLCEAAILRCYELIKEIIPGAEADGPMVDAYPVKFPEITVTTSTDFIRKKLGEFIDDGRIFSILTALAFDVKADGGNFTVKVPAFRATKDISLPEDIVEEVGRVHRYDNIEPKPPMVACEPPMENPARRLERRIKTILTRDFHLTEVYNYSFVGEDTLTQLGVNEDRELRLKNPLSRDMDRLRRSLVPNLLKNIELNQRYHENFRLFEYGRVYLKNERLSKDLAREIFRTAGVVYAKKPAIPLFYDVKNIVAGLLSQLGVQSFSLVPAGKKLPVYAHPGRSMEVLVDKKHAGWIFEPHPAIREAIDLKGSAALFDIDTDLILNAPKTPPGFNEPSKFPEVPFEISVVAEKKAYAGTVEEIIRRGNRELIRDIEVLSVYEGAPLPEGHKSISFKITFGADRTLGPEEIDRLQKKVVADLNAGGYKLR